MLGAGFRSYQNCVVNLTRIRYDGGTMPQQKHGNPRDIPESDAGCERRFQVAHEVMYGSEQAGRAERMAGRGPASACRGVDGDYAAVVTADGGRWVALCESGPSRAMPGDLLAETMDRDAVRAQANWAAAPLAARAAQAEALVLHWPKEGNAEMLAAFESLLPVFREILALVRLRHQQAGRIRRLETVLEIAQQWNQTREVEPLLVQMAEAATRLFHCDRASIFLWDRPNRVLIGRPALGVKGGELRVADDRGVVGRVLQSGQPLRVSDATAPDVIDHQIDAQLRYRTRTLLCVPLQTRTGERLGVFELLNKLAGTFSLEDETGLTELAAHAAVALENVQDRQRLLATNRQLVDQAAEGIQLIGECPAIEALRSIVSRVAQTDLAVLIGGENGTGKEVVAQSIHYLSRRRGQPFIALNCAAIPEIAGRKRTFWPRKGRLHRRPRGPSR